MTAYRDRGPAHDSALPTFLDPATRAESTSVALATAASPIEIPGQYVRYALGSDTTYFARNMVANEGFTGWTAVDRTGNAIAANALPTKVGIIIRERPVPNFNYHGLSQAAGRPAEPADGAYLPDRTIGSDTFVPYAYGKHKDNSFWPFTEYWIGNNVLSGTTDFSASIDSTFISNSLTGPNAPDQSFQQDETIGGLLKVSARVRGGAGTTPTDPNGTLDPDGFYRDNWRFIHLRREQDTIISQAEPRIDASKATAYFPRANFEGVEGRLTLSPNGNLIDATTSVNDLWGEGEDI